MILKLKRLFDIVGEKTDFEFEILSAELEAYKNYSFLSPISISGTLENRAGVVSVSYSTNFCMGHCCDRCLKEFSRDYSFNFSHILVRSLSGESDDYIICENDELNISELSVSDLLLQLPSKILCKDECKGLCFICGNDLNESECNCEKKKP